MADSSQYQNLISPRSRAPIVLTDEDDIDSGNLNEFNNVSGRDQRKSVQDLMRIQESRSGGGGTGEGSSSVSTNGSSSTKSYASRIRRRTSSGGSASRTKDRGQLTPRSKSSEEASLNNGGGGGFFKTPPQPSSSSIDVRKLIKQVNSTYVYI